MKPIIDKDKSLMNAFALVRETHIELAELYKDFEAELNKFKFVSIHNGSDVGTERSTSLNNPAYWLFPYTSRTFVKNADNSDNQWYASASMIHYNRSKDEPIIPRLLIGFVKKEIAHSNLFEYWWLVSMYESDYGRLIQNSKGKIVDDITDQEWFRVKPVKGDDKGSEKWYDEGYIYSKKLTSLSNKNDVRELAETLNDKYNSVLGL